MVKMCPCALQLKCACLHNAQTRLLSVSLANDAKHMSKLTQHVAKIATVCYTHTVFAICAAFDDDAFSSSLSKVDAIM